MACLSSDECKKTSFCWNRMCSDTKDKAVCAKYVDKKTTDGWTWTQISQDPNMRCENKAPKIPSNEDDIASPKPLEADHVDWKGFVKYTQKEMKKQGTWPF